MNIIKRIKSCINNLRINKYISTYKYIHIMFNDTFNKPYVDFLNNNFDSKDHLILCKRWSKEFPFPQGDNVVEIQSLTFLNFKNAKNEKIIFHSLLDGEFVNYLYKHKDILREKAYWIIWGGDLYNATRNKKNDYVRKNIKGYISVVEGDEILAKNKYQSSAYVMSAPYIDPVTKEMLKKTKVIKSKVTTIQINNSCDETTLDMLDILKKFKDENIKIKTILSYGKMEYKEKIIKKGKEIFGDKFEYLNDYIAPAKYVEYLAENDVLILNQNRQQGLGNVTVAAYYGTKIYIKHEITSVKYLQQYGMNIFDSNKISNLSFSDFKYISNETMNANKLASESIRNGTYVAKKWNIIFNR